MLSFFALLPITANAQCPDNNHPHMIDLGLPSGTKWACCNVGASKPEDCGDYFAWGETEKKDYYDWSTYIHCDGSWETCHDIGKDIAGTQYDAATANWGSPWVMPSLDQVKELFDNCTKEWTTENGVYGRRFTASNGASIFLPIAGFRYFGDLYLAGSAYYYWSSSLDESATYNAYYIGEAEWNTCNRPNGQSVRPVVAGSSTPSGNIDFADPAVKAICVANWDTNGDGELSYDEAAAVTDIGTGFANNKDITSFDELQYFTGVTELSEAAFSFSSNLQSITIPKSVTNIGRLLLIDCENLISIRVDEENSSYDSRDNCNAIIETASNRLISGCMNTVIPNSVESIGDCSFEGHSGLLSITIPNSVKVIDFGAFNGCRGLSSIIIPKSVTYIGVSAFANCSGLKTIQVEDGNPNYDSRNNCNAIISTYDNGLIAGCMSTVIPNTVTSIKSFAFCGCTGLTSLDIPNSVTSIGYLAFSDCSNMTSITIPNSVITIEDAAFQNCSGISSLDFPNSLTSIGEAAFTGCTNLSAITIPESVTSIGDRAFTWCVSLEKVFSYIKEPFEIASDAFSIDWGGKSTAATLYVPVGCKAKYMATAGWNKFQNIVEMGEATGIAIDATNFPDENFRNWVLAQDYGLDGVLTEAEIDGVTEIDIDSQNIADLKGLEYFTALTQLWCDYNELTSLDVSKNTALTRLCCAGNQLTSLDLSQNTALITLYCYENQINETEMGKLVESLPANNGELLVKRLDISNEQNVITTEQVAAAKAKGWYVLALDGNVGEWGEWVEYDGDASAGIPINSTTFPDENFRNWVLAQDYGQDGVLTETEIAGVKEIEVGSKSIIDLKGIEYFTALTYLDCSSNQLASLDVSKNKDLEALDCNNNQLTTLDMSNNTALTGLFFSCNQLTSLDVSKNTALKWLVCDNNQLTSLDLLKNTALVELYCYNNQINGASMDALIAGLPSTGGDFFAIAPVDSREQNVVTKAQVTAAKEKGWTTYYWNLETGKFEEYEGCDSEIAPVEQGETIDIGKEIDENTSLDGNVVGDVYYSISSGDGNYDAAEGCLVVTKPTNDSAIDGQDIFGEDFKDNYTGIVFKLAPGKGTIKVEAETQGNMVLKVKIGNSDPIEMELDGKLKVKFPYNVSEPTYVYIYGGMGAAGAKAMGANRAKSAADLLKIYGFEIVSDPSGIDAIENGQQQDAPVYNLNGQRVNTPGKGIYIKNGRKVLVK
jgi:Leucine-rich repeat (LRR) protein